jgi:hypothetical protein
MEEGSAKNRRVIAMDWKEKLQSARKSGQDALEQKAQAAIEENWPKIQQLFHEKVGPAALTAAQNDGQMERLFKVVYLALPFPLNLAVKEDAFVKFCFGRRDQLLPRTGGAAGGA